MTYNAITNNYTDTRISMRQMHIHHTALAAALKKTQKNTVAPTKDNRTQECLPAGPPRCGRSEIITFVWGPEASILKLL